VSEFCGRRLGKARGVWVAKVRRTSSQTASEHFNAGMRAACGHAAMTVEEVDAGTGPAVGRRSRRLVVSKRRIVGLDVSGARRENIYEDGRRTLNRGIVQSTGVVEEDGQARLAGRQGAGFYKKVKGEGEGNLTLDVNTMEYSRRAPILGTERKLLSLEREKRLRHPGAAIAARVGPVVLEGQKGEKAAAVFLGRAYEIVFVRGSRRVPEISHVVDVGPRDALGLCLGTRAVRNHGCDRQGRLMASAGKKGRTLPAVIEESAGERANEAEKRKGFYESEQKGHDDRFDIGSGGGEDDRRAKGVDHSQVD